MHYLAEIKKLSTLSRETTSRNNGDYLYYLPLFRAKIKLISHEKVCKDHDFCDIFMYEIKCQSILNTYNLLGYHFLFI